MLTTLHDIFSENTIEVDNTGKRVRIHSHTSLQQGIFIQQLFDKVNPVKSLEIGMAYGVSTLFILEKHRKKGSPGKSHIVIEPFPWGDAPTYNFEKEGLIDLVDIRYDFSDVVIPQLYYANEKIQFAYVDTTKLFDVVMQDFYFIDKILDVGGVIIIDDCDTGGINKVARFINSLPHYKVIDRTGQTLKSWRYRLLEKIITLTINVIPFKRKLFPNFSFKTDRQLNLDFRCLAFKKIAQDSRKWDWFAPL